MAIIINNFSRQQESSSSSSSSFLASTNIEWVVYQFRVRRPTWIECTVHGPSIYNIKVSLRQRKATTTTADALSSLVGRHTGSAIDLRATFIINTRFSFQRIWWIVSHGERKREPRDFFFLFFFKQEMTTNRSASSRPYPLSTATI